MNRFRLIQFFWVTLPASIIVFTTFVVIFGEEGLFAQKRAKEQLHYLESESVKVEDDNTAIEMRVSHIRSNRNQLYVLASDRLLVAPKGATIYRFLTSSNY